MHWSPWRVPSLRRTNCPLQGTLYLILESLAAERISMACALPLRPVCTDFSLNVFFGHWRDAGGFDGTSGSNDEPAPQALTFLRRRMVAVCLRYACLQFSFVYA